MAERIVGEMTRVDVRIEAYDLRFEETEEQLREFRADPPASCVASSSSKVTR
jgi:hypothetical protein